MKLERKDWPTYLYPHAWAINEIHVGKTCRSGSVKLGNACAHAHCHVWSPYPRCICTKKLDHDTMIHEIAHILAGPGDGDGHDLVWELTLEAIGGAALRRRETYNLWANTHPATYAIVPGVLAVAMGCGLGYLIMAVVPWIDAWLLQYGG